MPTPHIEAQIGEIASLVIMPGDPNRCDYIAKKYLKDYKLVNSVRGELAFTGYYKDKKVTVFSSGMGIPSMGIYSHELFSQYGVDVIIRVGSAGSYVNDVNIKDLFLVESSFTDSNYAENYIGSSEKLVYSSKEVNTIITNTAKEMNISLKSGTCHSSEAFYTEINLDELIKNTGVKCVEMESFSLFLNAYNLNKKASCLLTISDSFVTDEHLSIKDREKSFDTMITLALESIIKM